MSHRHITVLCVASCVLLIAAGCRGSQEGPRTYPVSGVVTYNDTPVAGALILFRPIEQSLQPVQASTNQKGHFEAETYLAGDFKRGMVPGEYLVEIKRLERPENMNQEPRNLLPARYASAATSGLKATVRSDRRNDFTFLLND